MLLVQRVRGNSRRLNFKQSEAFSGRVNNFFAFTADVVSELVPAGADRSSLNACQRQQIRLADSELPPQRFRKLQVCCAVINHRLCEGRVVRLQSAFLSARVCVCVKKAGS